MCFSQTAVLLVLLTVLQTAVLLVLVRVRHVFETAVLLVSIIVRHVFQTAVLLALLIVRHVFQTAILLALLTARHVFQTAILLALLIVRHVFQTAVLLLGRAPGREGKRPPCGPKDSNRNMGSILVVTHRLSCSYLNLATSSLLLQKVAKSRLACARVVRVCYRSKEGFRVWNEF